MGLDCQKCLSGVYNLVLGFCYYCKAYGMLGAGYIHCKTGKYSKIAINCLNPRYGTVYTCPDMTYNRYWYDAVQESFDKHTRQMNQIMRWNTESDAKETVYKKMKEDVMSYKLQDHVVANLMQAYMAVTNITYAKEL